MFFKCYLRSHTATGSSVQQARSKAKFVYLTECIAVELESGQVTQQFPEIDYSIRLGMGLG